MKWIVMVPALLAGCASGIVDLRPVAIEGICFIEEIEQTTVINGRAGVLLGTIYTDISIIQVITGTYEDPNC